MEDFYEGAYVSFDTRYHCEGYVKGLISSECDDVKLLLFYLNGEEMCLSYDKGTGVIRLNMGKWLSCDIRFSVARLRGLGTVIDYGTREIRLIEGEGYMSVLKTRDKNSVAYVGLSIRDHGLYEVLYKHLGARRVLLRCCYYRLIDEKELKMAIKSPWGDYGLCLKYGDYSEFRAVIRSIGLSIDMMELAIACGRISWLENKMEWLYRVWGSELPVELLDSYFRPPNGKGWLKQVKELEREQEKYDKLVG